MLSKLPQEIAIQVLSYLSKSDILACLTVDQSHYQLIIPYLYKNVSSSDVSRINQGLRFLCDNPAIAQQVRNMKLRIDKGCVFVNKLALIPQLFSSLRELHVNADYDLPAPTQQTEPGCQRTLQRLTIRERGVSFASGLLQSGTFTSLTCLHFSFLQNFDNINNVITLPGSGQQQPHQAMVDMSRKIIPCFVHVPALTALNISYAKFDWDDMEQLHGNLPDMKELTLTNACFSVSPAESMANMSLIGPLTKLTSFHLTLLPDAYRRNVRHEIGRSLAPWLTYIGRNYTNLTALAMKFMSRYGTEYALNTWTYHNFFTAAKDQMQEIIAKLDGVDKIETQLFPFNEDNVKISSKHELQTVALFDSEVGIVPQMKNLYDSKQGKSIRSISLIQCNVVGRDNLDALRHIFTQYSFDQLTKIDIVSVRGTFEIRGYTLSLQLLQHVPSLEALKIYNISGFDQETPALPPSRLKSLDILYFHTSTDWRASNMYLEAILRASPRLETFNMFLSFIRDNRHQSRFVIDLTGNKHLKSVCLEYSKLDACLLLEHDPKRTKQYWKTLTKSIEEPAHINEELFLIDLRWNETTHVDAYPVNTII